METAVSLRPFVTDDYRLISQWRNDPDIQDSTGGFSRPVSPDVEKKWVEDKIYNNQCQFYWAIILPTEEMIGYIGFKDTDWVNRSILYHALVIGNPHYRNIKYSTGALRQSLRFIFYDLGMNRVWGYALNEGSIMIGNILGFRKEGVLREAIYKNGHFQDATQISLLRSDFDQLHVADN